jgi:hypothetical protein
MIRIKSRWFKRGRKKKPEELAGAAAFAIWRIAQNTLKNIRKAGFGVAVGGQYFVFLSELLIFLVQVADRIAYARFAGEARVAFTTELASRVAETLAWNQGDLLGGAVGEYKRSFIERLNLRAGEYSEYEYGGDGASFSFLRCLANSMLEAMDERDKIWAIDQMMAVEAPQAVAMVENAMRGYLDTEQESRAVRKNSDED